MPLYVNVVKKRTSLLIFYSFIHKTNTDFVKDIRNFKMFDRYNYEKLGREGFSKGFEDFCTFLIQGGGGEGDDQGRARGDYPP